MRRAIYNQTLVHNWTVQGYNTIIYPNSSASDSGEITTQCAMIAPNASFSFTAPGPDFFLGKLSITFWAQYASGSRDLQLTLASSADSSPQVQIYHGTSVEVCIQTSVNKQLTIIAKHMDSHAVWQSASRSHTVLS